MSTENTGDNILPKNLNAGDTWQFTLSFPAYPANAGWSAKWQLLGPGTSNTFNATTNPNGTDFDFLVSATASAAINATVSAIQFAARVIVTGSGQFSGQQFTALPASPIGGWQRVIVAPNFSVITSFDVRTATETELATLQATILALETNQVKSATFGGQTFAIQDINELRQRELQLIERIKDQQVRANVNAGRGSGRRVNIQFINV